MGWLKSAYNGTIDWLGEKTYDGIMGTAGLLGYDTEKLNDTLAGQTPEDRARAPLFHDLADVLTPNWLNMENVLTGGAAFLAGTLGGNALFGSSGLGMLTGALATCASLFFKGDVKELFSGATSNNEVALLENTGALAPILA